MKDAVHITRLSAENIMRLEAVEVAFEPTGGLTIIGGQNGAGKSSVLNAIAMALGGKKLCPKQPIRQGHTKASVKVTLDNGLVVERRFTKKGDYLHVTRGDEKVSNPQALLDDLRGALTFDPLAFARMEAKDQGEVLRGIVGLDFSGQDKKRQTLYDDRRDVNRALRDAEGSLKVMPEAPGDTPDGEVSITDLSEELERCQTHNANAQKLADTVEAKKRQLEIWMQQRGEVRAQVEQRQKELAQARARLQSTNDHVDEGKQQLAEAVKASEGKQPEDTEPIKEQLRQADATNANVRRKQARAAQAAKVTELRGKSDDLTQSIEGIDAEKQKALADAEYPIDRLALTPEGDVAYKDLPFGQAADSEKLRISLAIGSALNPTLRFCSVRDGSLLDDDSLAEVAKMAAEADLRVLLERVGDGDECSVIIEDGRVR